MFSTDTVAIEPRQDQGRTGNALPQARFTPALFNRRSVRRYLPEQPPLELINTLLEMAVCAPSAHNRQPWRFVVIRSHDKKAKLARAMGDKLERDRLADNDDPTDVKNDVARSFARITNAPTLILLCVTMAEMDSYRDANRNQHEFCMATQSVAMAGQNIMLGAQATGLSSCWMCAPMFCPTLVQTTLDLPEDWIPQGMLTVGYPANAGKPFVRKPLEDVVAYIDDAPSAMSRSFS
ncbi:MAG: nitroreductase [Pusillimonas sp.]|nr:nitroreductase [Pusillimonas sp.]MBC43098.1 nitroreductase [Pusillimonas sp.]HCP76945.1 nitroreductase [Pusillimonas sp.]|tara:strand:+ start:15835 stop:16542 length:708 start_codon:yes stop_codon:yes gene_type:complete